MSKINQGEANYDKAVVCLKLLLLTAWLENSSEYETLAYENMAM